MVHHSQSCDYLQVSMQQRPLKPLPSLPAGELSTASSVVGLFHLDPPNSVLCRQIGLEGVFRFFQPPQKVTCGSNPDAEAFGYVALSAVQALAVFLVHR
jgi:hypothetical protein